MKTHQPSVGPQVSSTLTRQIQREVTAAAPTLEWSVSSTGTDLADSQATVTAIQIPGDGRFDDRAQHEWGQPS